MSQDSRDAERPGRQAQQGRALTGSGPERPRDLG